MRAVAGSFNSSLYCIQLLHFSKCMIRMCELDIELCEESYISIWVKPLAVCRPQNGSRAELLKEEMDDVIVIFSYFWLSLQL